MFAILLKSSSKVFENMTPWGAKLRTSGAFFCFRFCILIGEWYDITDHNLN
jgi:hypothetical protein